MDANTNSSYKAGFYWVQWLSMMVSFKQRCGIHGLMYHITDNIQQNVCHFDKTVFLFKWELLQSEAITCVIVHGKYFIIIFLVQRVYKIFVWRATLVLRLLLNFIAHQFVYVPQLFFNRHWFLDRHWQSIFADQYKNVQVHYYIILL